MFPRHPGIALPIVLLTAGHALGQTQGSAAAPARAAEEKPAASDADAVLRQSIDLIQREYYDAGVTREELVEAALQGMVDHLNYRAAKAGNRPVNAVLSRAEMGRLTAAISGEGVGLGVLARRSTEGVQVLQVFDGSPAGKAGLRAGDHITAIDDRSLADGDDAELFGLLRGDDGSAVRLSVLRTPGDTFELKVTRGRYRVAAVHSQMLEGDIGYLRLASLARGTADQVAGCLSSLRTQGAAAILLDLRGNGGGSLDEATAVASMFLEPGKPVVQIMGRTGPQTLSASGDILWSGYTTVLVDRGTASAAEALASALQADGKRLFGESTAGLGLGESVFTLPAGGGLRLATARYASPSGESWIARGLKPDVPVEAVDPEHPASDPQLQVALATMRSFKPTLPVEAR